MINTITAVFLKYFLRTRFYARHCIVSLTPYSNPVNRWHYYWHFRDEETGSDCLMNLLKVTQHKGLYGLKFRSIRLQSHAQPPLHTTSHSRYNCATQTGLAFGQVSLPSLSFLISKMGLTQYPGLVVTSKGETASSHY